MTDRVGSARRSPDPSTDGRSEADRSPAPAASSDADLRSPLSSAPAARQADAIDPEPTRWLADSAGFARLAGFAGSGDSANRRPVPERFAADSVDQRCHRPLGWAGLSETAPAASRATVPAEPGFAVPDFAGQDSVGPDPAGSDSASSNSADLNSADWNFADPKPAVDARARRNRL
jgi:hypothetical protein